MSRVVDFIGTDLRFDQGERDLDGTGNDLQTISGSDNLAQSIYLRLMTPMGTDPFAPEYGSRVHFLLGKGQSEDNELVARMYVGESLIRDNRITHVEDPKVQYEGNELFIQVTVIGVNDTLPIDITSKVTL